MVQQAGDGNGTPGFEFAVHPLHELLEVLKGLVGEIDIVDPVNLVVPELDIAAERGSVEVVAADCLDDVVGEICAGRNQDIDVAVLDEIGDDPAHAGRDHSAGKPEEFCRVAVPQHLLVDICCMTERAAVVCAGLAHCIDKLPDRHTGPDMHLGDRFIALVFHYIFSSPFAVSSIGAAGS